MIYQPARWRVSILFPVLAFLFFLMAPIAHGEGSALAPFRITPERRQLIGLKFATVMGSA